MLRRALNLLLLAQAVTPRLPSQGPARRTEGQAKRSGQATTRTGTIEDAQRRVVAIVQQVRDKRGADHYVPFGTAFFINAEGYLATCAHVVRAAEKRRIAGVPVCLRYPARFAGLPFGNLPPENASVLVGYDVIAADDHADTALIKARDRLQNTPAHVTLSDERPRLGAEVVFTGHPHAFAVPVAKWARIAAEETTLPSGTIIQITEGKVPESEFLLGTFFLVDVLIDPGFSGAPVYLTDIGAAIGIASGSYGVGIGVVRPIRRLVELLDEKKISYSVAPKHPRLKRPN